MDINVIADKFVDLIENKKAYLDPDYTIEKMARDMSEDEDVAPLFEGEMEYSFEETMRIHRGEDINNL